MEMGSPKGGGGQGGGVPPKASGGAPHPRVSNPRRRGAKGGAPAHQGLVPLPLQPMGPSGIGGPTRWTPGTLPWSRYNTSDPRNLPDGKNCTSYI